jgi:hypothetical protein
MKKIFVFLLSLFFIASLSAQDTTAYPGIKKVIEGETLAFANADLTTWSAYFVHEPYVRWSVSPAMFFDGWQALYDGARAFLASQQGRSDANQLHTITRSNWNIHINGNVALVKFVQSTEGTVGASQQFRVLEKTGDDWKISMLVAVQ